MKVMFRILAGLALFLFSGAAPAADKLPGCAVMTFEAKNGVSKEESAVLADGLESELIELKLYRMVSRANLTKVLEAQKISLECAGTECAIEAGKIASIEFVVFGSIGKVGETYSLVANLANVETGVIEKTAKVTQSGKIDQLLIAGVAQAAKKLMGLAVADVEPMAPERPAPTPGVAEERPLTKASAVPAGFKAVGVDADPASGLPMTIVHELTGYRLKLAPEGSFLMGSPAGEGFYFERPQRRLNVSAFWIGETEVTCEQFARFLNDKGNRSEGAVTWCNVGGQAVKIEQVGCAYRAKNGYERHPVVELSWFGARALARWMGGDLPSEAQWEKAVRGGKNVRYPWGDEWDSKQAATAERIAGVREFKTEQEWREWWEPYQKKTLTKRNDWSDTTVPVKTYMPNGYGLYDMAGNAWEWCRDWYAVDQYDRWWDGMSNPVNEEGGDMQTVEYWQEGEKKTDRQACRVVRGGGWYNRASVARCASRNWAQPAVRATNGGVRVVVAPRP